MPYIEKRKKKKNNKNKKYIFLGIVLLSILIIVIVVILLSGKFGKKEDNSLSDSSEENFPKEEIVSENTVVEEIEEDKIYVIQDKVNIRSGAGYAYESLSVVNRDTVVEILDKEDNPDGRSWYKVSVNGLEGYIADYYLSDYSGEQPEQGAIIDASLYDSLWANAACDENRMFVAGDMVNVRQQPSADAAKVSSLAKNTIVYVIGEALASDGYTWYCIGYEKADNEEGKDSNGETVIRIFNAHCVGYIRSDLLTR